jgi:PAS domain S-box-containing protein
MLRVLADGRQQEFPQFGAVRALFEDRSGTLWIGSEGEGVTVYRNGQFTSMVAAIKAHEPPASTTVLPMAMAFAQDSDGTLYVGLRETGGLVKIKGDAITVLHSSQGFPTNEIRAIYPDREGNLWLGTKGDGLVVFSGGQWLHREVLSATFNDQVAAILEDDSGRLWLGTPKGIVWAPKAHLLALARGENTSPSFRLALASDGVRPGVVGAGSFPVAAKAADGTLWFSSRHGITVVDPRNVALNHVPPQVHIERALVDSKPVDHSGGINLPPGSRTLAIDYTAPSFVGPTQVLFRYRLEGLEREWTDAGPRRTAFFTTLAPGAYRFHVIACNDDGVWNETGASIAVVQLPFFYQTRWFYGASALALLAAVLGIFRWRTAALQRRNVELERGIAQRTAELAKSYEAIRASEYFYHSLVESLPQIIARKDVESRFTYANSAFAELIGRPLDEIIGQAEAAIYPPEKSQKFRADDLRAMETHQTLEYESVAERAGQGRRYLHVKKVPLYDQQGRPLGVQILFWDMTTFREVEEKLRQAQRELIETSRLAGIAEMATGILHNLGNALNSVNVTTISVAGRLRQSKITFVTRTAQLLAENDGRLPEFLSSDPRGRQLPTYLAQLGLNLTTERDEILHELQALQENVDQIKALVASQQRHAAGAGVTELIPASELVEYALLIAEASLSRHGIIVVREFSPTPPVKVERQKALQLIGNLIANARDAIVELDRAEKRLSVGVRVTDGGRVQISVTDNGVGIAPGNLTKIFAFGFTTKKDGHGFGLHSGALAAREMGGSLHASSEGLGQGATFIFELPPAP